MKINPLCVLVQSHANIDDACQLISDSICHNSNTINNFLSFFVKFNNQIQFEKNPKNWYILCFWGVKLSCQGRGSQLTLKANNPQEASIQLETFSGSIILCIIISELDWQLSIQTPPICLWKCLAKQHSSFIEILVVEVIVVSHFIIATYIHTIIYRSWLSQLVGVSLLK